MTFSNCHVTIWFHNTSQIKRTLFKIIISFRVLLTRDACTPTQQNNDARKNGRDVDTSARFGSGLDYAMQHATLTHKNVGQAFHLRFAHALSEMTPLFQQRQGCNIVLT